MYLLENSPEAEAMRQNVRRLLQSSETENIDLALQLIEGGGLHQDTEVILLKLYEQRILTLEEILKLPDFMLRVIQHLKIYHVKLKHLPEIVFQCANLRILQTYETNFVAISDKIADLKQLEFLSFIYDKISTIPQALLNLPNLKNLMFSRNKITNLPTEIKKLQQLQMMTIGANQLTVLPDEIGELKNLNNLSFNGNKITDIPDSLWDLPNLKTLSMEYNELACLSEAVGKAGKLENLHLTTNNLKALPASITQLKKLQRLDAKPRKGTLKLTEEQKEFLKYVAHDLGKIWETYRYEDD